MRSAARIRVVRNVITTLATQIFTWAMTFLVTLYLPRYAQDEGMGRITFAFSFNMITAAVAPLGIATALLREVARNHARAGDLLLGALVLRIALALGLSAVTCAVAALLGYGPEMRLMILLGAVIVVVSTANGVFAATLQGMELLPRQNLASVLERTLSAAITIGLIHLRAPLYLLVGAGILPALAQSVYYLWALRGVLRSAVAPSVATMRFLVRAGLPFLGWAVVMTLYGQTDPLVLKMVANFHSVGWYALAFRLEGTTLFLPVAVTTALLPTLSRAFQESPEHQFVTLARRAMEIILLCGVPIGLAMMTVPDQIIHLLHYPPSFDNAIPVLRLAGIGTLLYYVTQILGALVMASNREMQMFRTTVAASLVGIPLCFLFSWAGHRWFGNGAAGALLSDLVLEVILVVGYLKTLPRGLFGGPIFSRCARYALAALPMCAVLYWAAGARLGLWAILPAAAVYAAGCFLLRAVNRADFALLRGVLSRKAGIDGPETAGVPAA